MNVTLVLATLATLLLVALAAPAEASAPEATCIPTSGGMDYHSYLCVDAGDLKCPVYTLTSSDRGVVRTCIPPR